MERTQLIESGRGNLSVDDRLVFESICRQLGQKISDEVEAELPIFNDTEGLLDSLPPDVDIRDVFIA